MGSTLQARVQIYRMHPSQMQAGRGVFTCRYLPHSHDVGLQGLGNWQQKRQLMSKILLSMPSCTQTFGGRQWQCAQRRRWRVSAAGGTCWGGLAAELTSPRSKEHAATITGVRKIGDIFVVWPKPFKRPEKKAQRGQTHRWPRGGHHVNSCRPPR